jgi:hypothetical protein
MLWPVPSVENPKEVATELLVRAEAHRDSVWLALCPSALLIGVALATTGILRIPTPSKPEPHPGVMSHVSTAILFVVGAILVLVGLYIAAAAFFFDWWLPETRRERQLHKASKESEESSSGS